MTLFGKELQKRINSLGLPGGCRNNISKTGYSNLGGAPTANKKPAKRGIFIIARLFGKFWRHCGLIKLRNVSVFLKVVCAAALKFQNFILYLLKNAFAKNHICARRALAAICILALSATTPCINLFGDTHIIENGSCEMEIILPQNVHKADAEAANTLARELAKLACGGNIKVSFLTATRGLKQKFF